MAARDKAKDDKQKAAKAKEREKAAKAKEKEKAARAKEKERARKAKDKERAARAKAKERAAKAKEKERAAKAKEREKAAKAKDRADKQKAKDRADKQKAKDRAAKDAAKQRRAEDRAEREQPADDAPAPVEESVTEQSAEDATAATTETTESEAPAATDDAAGTEDAPARPARRRRTARTAAPALEPVPANDKTIRPKGYIAEALGKEDAVERATQRATLAASYTTRDHDVIRAWAETRGGRPADVTGTGRRGRGGAGVLRIEFPDGPGDDSRLSDVDWSTFFSTFDTSDVDFLYQERVRTGDISRFHKRVRADA